MRNVNMLDADASNLSLIDFKGKLLH